MRFQSAVIVIAILTASMVFADDIIDEAKAIEKIELLGGKITRDETLPGRPVIGVDFRGSRRFSENYLHLLNAFPQLTSLNLSYCKQMTDAGLAEIGNLKNLTTLNLTHAEITDEGLRTFSGLTQLTTLDLSQTKITDAGLNQIGKLTQLITLNVSGTKITDQGLKELGRLKYLTSLSLSLTQITDVGLSELKELKSLSTLRLSGDKVTDDGLKNIKGINSLMTLSLVQTEITEVGLVELSGLQQLTTLYLCGTKINYDGIAEPLNATEFDSIENALISQAKKTDLEQRITLKKLRLKPNPTDPGVKELQKALPHLKVYK